MLFDFSFDMPISSDNAATTIQKAGCCRNSMTGVAPLPSGYGRPCCQRIDERFRQVVLSGDLLHGGDQLST